MKSRQRPPLILSDAEPLDAVAAEPISPPVEDEAPAPAETASPTPERPMSERRRRRLAEEKRLAEQRAARTAAVTGESTEAEATSLDPGPSVVADFAVPAGSPPAAFDPSPPPVALPAPAATGPTHGGHAYLIAGLASVVWIGGVAAWLAFEIGSGSVELEPLRLAVYAMIALAPAGMAIMLAHAVRQGSGLAAETRRARELSDALLAPTALAARQTGEVLQSLRGDIDQATLATERARADMALLREALALETGRLNEAAETAGRTARRLVEQLGQEREAMASLGSRLDTQSAGVMDAVERQSRMVVDASDLAQTQLREAEAALAARAADLAAAAGEAQDAARLASDDLARQTLRLENAGAGVAEQIQSVEEGLGQQRAALVTAAYALRTDQEDFSAQVESQRAQLTEQLSAARSAANELGQTSLHTTESLKELVEAASDQFRALVEMSQREADGFDAATKVALDKFESLSAEARDALVEETRRALVAMQATADEARAAADEAAVQAQVRADRLGQALFDAAQQADQAADARIEGARRIVSESVDLVDEAGERAIQRLESTVERMNAALGRIEDTMGDLDERAALLPEQARERVEAIRVTVEEGLAALAAASRKAAEDTEALDVGFQERVRRNYEMLTEAVRLMGVVSGDGPTGRRRDASLALPAEPRERPAPVRPEPDAQRPDRGFGLRGRLRLEPTPEAAPVQHSANDGLGWSDLVDDGPGEAPMDLDTPIMPPADAEALTERIAAAIRRMGVDPNALLPRSRVEEAAHAFADGEPSQARAIVRRVAPAAVRSVSRRVLSDPGLRTDAERYVREFVRGLDDYARSGDGAAILNRLASDGGRAFLLLDAAVGDLS
jgi:hypothetical protein